MDTPFTIIISGIIGLMVGLAVFQANQIAGIMKLIKMIRERQDEEIDKLREGVRQLGQIVIRIAEDKIDLAKIEGMDLSEPTISWEEVKARLGITDEDLDEDDE